MLSIKPKIAFTIILEASLPPMAVNSYYDHYTKNIISKSSAVLYKTLLSL